MATSTNTSIVPFAIQTLGGDQILVDNTLSTDAGLVGKSVQVSGTQLLSYLDATAKSLVDSSLNVYNIGTITQNLPLIVDNTNVVTTSNAFLQIVAPEYFSATGTATITIPQTILETTTPSTTSAAAIRITLPAATLADAGRRKVFTLKDSSNGRWDVMTPNGSFPLGSDGVSRFPRSVSFIVDQNGNWMVSDENYVNFMSLRSHQKYTTGVTTGTNQFGCVKISPDGNYMFIGAANNTGGLVRVYYRTNIGSATVLWGAAPIQAISPPVTATTAHFGNAIACSRDGTYLAIGGLTDATSSANQGAVWLYVKTGTGAGATWALLSGGGSTPKIVGATSATGDLFGTSLSMSHDGLVLAIGAPGRTTNRGAVYIFNQVAANQYTENATPGALSPANIGTGVSSNAEVGTSVALSSDGRVLHIGCPADNTSGSVINWLNTTGTWTVINKRSSPVAGTVRFGYSVATGYDGSYTVIGVPGASANVGRVYIATGRNTSLNTVPLTQTAVAGQTGFGWSVAMSTNGAYILVGTSSTIGAPVSTVGNVQCFATTDGFPYQQFPVSLLGVNGATNFNGFSVSMSDIGDVSASITPYDTSDNLPRVTPYY